MTNEPRESVKNFDLFKKLRDIQIFDPLYLENGMR